MFFLWLNWFLTYAETSSGKFFKISIEIDVLFVKWKPPFCNNDNIGNMVDTAATGDRI